MCRLLSVVINRPRATRCTIPAAGTDTNRKLHPHFTIVLRFSTPGLLLPITEICSFCRFEQSARFQIALQAQTDRVSPSDEDDKTHTCHLVADLCKCPQCGGGNRIQSWGNKGGYVGQNYVKTYFDFIHFSANIQTIALLLQLLIRPWALFCWVWPYLAMNCLITFRFLNST